MTNEELERLKEYAIPQEAGLGSDARICGKVILGVLNMLRYPELRFASAHLPNSYAWNDQNDGYSFEHDCLAFRLKLFARLRVAGWIIKHDETGELTVKRA